MFFPLVYENAELFCFTQSSKKINIALRLCMYMTIARFNINFFWNPEIKQPTNGAKFLLYLFNFQYLVSLKSFAATGLFIFSFENSCTCYKIEALRVKVEFRIVIYIRQGENLTL